MLTPISLPYEESELEPHISKETLHFHYDKHYKTYIKNANELMKHTVYEDMEPERVLEACGTKLYNQLAQALNHEMYFKCMTPGGSDLSAAKELLDPIKTKWDNIDKFKETFLTTAEKTFGSGWCWLSVYDGELSITSTSNAKRPTDTPILVVDVWEHAYYLDQQNKRGEYLKQFWEVINWPFVLEQYKKAVL